MTTAGVALDEAFVGPGRLVIVEGEAGIGKTTLVTALAERARANGVVVLLGAARELERDRPFGVMTEALEVSSRSEDPSMAAIGSLLESVDATPQPGLQYRIIESLVDAIERRCLDGPLLVVLEDVHWADTASIATLGTLARRAAQLSLGILVSTRPLPRTTELDAVIELAVHDHGRRIVLGPLDDEAMAGVLAERAGAPVGPRLLDYARGAAGNPFYACELVSALRLDGLIVEEDGRADIAAAAVPPALRLAIVRGLRTLSASAVDLLRTGAVLGSTFSLADVVTVRETSLDAAGEALREALAAGVLLERGELLAFRHDLVQEAVYADIPAALRTAQHVHAARALAASGAPASQVAAQFKLGAPHGDSQAVDWLLRAAREAADKDPDIALAQFRAAAELTADSRQRADIVADLAELMAWSGHGSDAAGMAEDALAEPGCDHDIAYRLRIALVVASLVDANVRQAHEHFAALDAMDLSAVERVPVAGWRAGAFLISGDFATGFASAEEALELAIAAGEKIHECAAWGGRSQLAYLNGDIEESIVFGRKSIPPKTWTRAAQLDTHRWAPPSWSFQSNLSLSLALLEADRTDEFVESIRAAQRGYEQTAIPTMLPMFHVIRGWKAWVYGAWDDAVVEFETGVATANEVPSNMLSYRGIAESFLAWIAVSRGDVDRAETLLSDIAGVVTGFSLIFFTAVEGVVAEARGDAETARQRIGAVWSLRSIANVNVMSRYVGPHHIRLQLASGNTTEAAGAASALEHLAERNPGIDSLAGMALRCRGLVTDDAASLVAAVERYRASPRIIEAASAAEDAGECLLRHGRPDEGVSLLNEALEVFEGVGASRDVRRIEGVLRTAGVRRGSRAPRGRPVSGWASLTESEVRVAELLAQRATNREIAEGLFISPRTVESHVSHILAKLGARSRRDVALVHASSLEQD